MLLNISLLKILNHLVIKCFVGKNVLIGDNCKIQNNVSLYDGVECQNNVFVGPSVVFTNVINPRSFIERKDEFKKTILYEGSSIGANATIICGNSIGKYSLVGAGSVVNGDVNDFELVVGNPIRRIGWIDKTGLKLDFSNQNTVTSNGLKYQLDDYKKNIVEWESKGGTGIHHTEVGKTVSKLKSLGFK